MQHMNFFLNLLTIKNKKRQKVFVGISGGVDSAVSAILLKKAGYDVTGVFIRTWQPDFIECTWRDERRDAIRICAHLNIPFLECDAEKEYRDLVGMQMINDYKNGLTPNPDILCNREVKFGVFWQFAKSLGADFIATGHYAKNTNAYLEKPKDTAKDQTYFLWTLKQEDLKHIIFPLAGLKKDGVRKIAKKYNLPNATKKDSQGVCFLGPIDLEDFISHYVDLKPGNVLDIDGKTIGNHKGAIIYTLGQRHGFNIENKKTDERPFYVVDRDLVNNTITVSHNYQDPKFSRVNYYLRNGFIRDHSDKPIYAIYRYNGEEVLITEIKQKNGNMEVYFEKELMISSGQSVVFYQNNLVIGGGICL